MTEPRAAALPTGLYEVISRSCENPEGGPDDCSRLQFLELVNGTFCGVEPGQTAFILWFASEHVATTYTYEVRPMRGHFDERGEYVVDEYPDAREWLALPGAQIHEYAFTRWA